MIFANGFKALCSALPKQLHQQNKKPLESWPNLCYEKENSKSFNHCAIFAKSALRATLKVLVCTGSPKSKWVF